MKAYRAAPSFRGDSAFYTWLYRIAINTAKNHLVAAGRKPISYDLDTQDPEQAGITERSARARHARGAGAIGGNSRHGQPRHPRTCRRSCERPFCLREIEGLSYEEIAQTMECPVGTVRSRIFRAREAIDKALAPLL